MTTPATMAEEGRGLFGQVLIKIRVKQLEAVTAFSYMSCVMLPVRRQAPTEKNDQNYKRNQQEFHKSSSDYLYLTLLLA